MLFFHVLKIYIMWNNERYDQVISQKIPVQAICALFQIEVKNFLL